MLRHIIIQILRFSIIVLIHILLSNFLQIFLRENTQKLPSHIQTLENSSNIISSLKITQKTYLSNKSIFKLIQKLDIKFILSRKRFFSNNCLHGKCILSLCIISVKLAQKKFTWFETEE